MKPGATVLVAGEGHPALAAGIARLALHPLAPAEVTRFEDGETRVRITGDLQDADVFLIQPTSPPVNDRLMALALLADSARGAGAVRVTAVMPYFGYARQDVRPAPGEPRSAALAARFLRTAGVARILTLEIHTPALESAFDGPFVNLHADDAFLPHLRTWDTDDLCIVSPDAGGLKRARRYAAALARPLALVVKARPAEGDVTACEVLGDVKGRRCVVVDDMATTGRTLAAAARALVLAGAREVHALFVHAVMTAQALERMREAGIGRILTTDSVPGAAAPGVEVLSVAPLLARAIHALGA